MNAKPRPRTPARHLHIACLLLLSIGCAGSGSKPAQPLPPAAPPAPAPVPGDAASAVIGGLDAAAEGSRVKLREMRMLRTDRDPWETVKPESAPADVVMMATRSCSYRKGLTHIEATRASWYVFEAGGLRAFDHSAFDGRCGVRRIFELSPIDRPEPERTLVRWVAQRHPDDMRDAADRLRLGMALVEARRLDEADRWLARGSREVEKLANRVRIVDDPEEATKDERLEELRALEATLTRRLKQARKAEAEAAAEPGADAASQSAP